VGDVMDFLVGDPSFLARLCVALVCGVAVGLERQWRGRQAGVRTNILVSVGSATFTYLSITAFGDQADGSRVAAQIVSGIGFLGAGVLLHRGDTVTGLNTAATLWASAAIGMAAGSAQYRVAILATVGVLIVQVVFRSFARRVEQLASYREPQFTYTLEVEGKPDALLLAEDRIVYASDDLALRNLGCAMRAKGRDEAQMVCTFRGSRGAGGEMRPIISEILSLADVDDLSWTGEPRTQRGPLRSWGT
jgi:uncharacterized membrane protein YhiD involved in acid resistance